MPSVELKEVRALKKQSAPNRFAASRYCAILSFFGDRGLDPLLPGGRLKSPPSGPIANLPLITIPLPKSENSGSSTTEPFSKPMNLLSK